MPAVYMLADSRQRVAEVKALNIFDDDRYYQDVYLPILADLGVDRLEMRRPKKLREIAVVTTTLSVTLPEEAVRAEAAKPIS